MKAYSMALGLLVLAGCASVHHVSPKRFEIEAHLIQTLHWSEYIGEADGKAYLLRKSAPLIGRNWNEEILYTEAAGLSPEFRKRLLETKKQKTSSQPSGATLDGAPDL